MANTCAYHSLCLNLITPATSSCQDCNCNLSEQGQVRRVACSEKNHLCVRCQESTVYDPIKTFKGLIRLRKDDHDRYETLINEVMALKYSNIDEVKKRYKEIFDQD